MAGYDISGMFDPTTSFNPDPNAYQYGGQQGGAQQRQNDLQQRGQAAQGREVPGVDYGQANQDYAGYQGTLGQQQDAANYFHDVMLGKAGPSLAEQQMNAGIDRTIAAQAAAAHSSDGGGQAFMAAQRNAALQGTQAQMQGVQQGAQLRAQEQQNARAMYAQQLAGMANQQLQARGQSAQMGQYGAGLALQSRGEGDQYNLGMQGLSNQVGLGQLQAREAEQQGRMQQDEYNAQARGNLFGGALGAGAGLMGLAFMSDETNKTNVAPTEDPQRAALKRTYFDDITRGLTQMSDEHSKTQIRDLKQERDAAMRALAAADAGDYQLSPDQRRAMEARMGMPSHAPAYPVREPGLPPEAYAWQGPSIEAAQGVTSVGPMNPRGSDAAYRTGEMVSTIPGHQRATRAVTPEQMREVAEWNARAAAENAAMTPTSTVQASDAARQAAALNAIQATGGTAAPVLTSDRNAKHAISEGTKAKSETEAFLDPLEGYSYDYKNPARDGEGRHYGVMAQDMERSPMGASMVHETPAGKVVDVRKAAMGSLAALAEIHKRVKRLEGRG